MITASHHLTYPHTGPELGEVLGSDTSGVPWMAVDKERQPDGRMLGFCALDTPEAWNLAAEWAAERQATQQAS